MGSSKKHKDKDRERDKEKRDKSHKKKRNRDKERESGSSPPKPSSASGDTSLSIEETNKLRLKLGLKPLQLDSASPKIQLVQPTSQKALVETTATGDEEEDVDDETTVQRLKEEREREGEVFWKEDQEFVHVPARELIFIQIPFSCRICVN